MINERPDPATVYEAAGRRGALPSEIKPIAERFRLWGPAFPVTCAPGDNLRLHEALYAADPDAVLVVRTGGAIDYGYWGELMTRAAQARGLGGLVIDGMVRDREALVQLSLPIFARGVSVRGTTKRATDAPRPGQAITVGDVRISAGDLVVGGADGVVVVPKPDIAAALERAAKRLAAETRLIAAIERGEKLIDLITEPRP